MSAKLWIARERYIPCYDTSEEEIRQLSDYLIWRNENEIVKSSYCNGHVRFEGSDYTLGSRVWEPILKEASLSLEPGDGPVPIEVTIRRLDKDG